MEKKLNFFQRAVAYTLFLSVFVRALHCYQSKRYTTERQFEEFRLFSLGGLIAFLVVVLLSTVIQSGWVLIYTFLGIFVLLERIEARFRISKMFSA